MARSALLLFAHQARSYAALIKEHLARLDMALLVLSSRPRDPRDLEQLAVLGPARLWHVPQDHLDGSHVPGVLQEAAAEGYEVVAALATFEGYRVLMAETNRRLQAHDADPAAVVHAMDKLLCRNRLADQGLSRARASVLDAGSLPALQAGGRRLFAKPRRGAGSFACFRLDDSLTAERLHELQQQMRGDQAFRAIFAGQFDFIAEDHLVGDEYSFEVMVAGGDSHVIGVHAKYLDDSSGTTLETSNSCPAPRLGDEQQLAGERYIGRCLAALDLAEGCYHIETRHDPRDGHWDVIEVNVRMGGALINQSIGVFTGGVSMLELWVQALCCRGAARQAWRERLALLRESRRRRDGTLVDGTVFFSRYGQRNRVLQELSLHALPRQPDLCDLPVRPGTRLPDSERGIFILNALWKVPIADIDRELRALSDMLDRDLVVRYGDDSPGADSPSPVPSSTADPSSKERPMNRVSRCGIDRPVPFYSLADGERIRERLDRYLDKKMAEWAATVPYANHLESKNLDSKWYRRHTIEHVWRIRLSRAAHCKALHAITKISPEAAQLYAQYQSEEMNHDTLFMQDCRSLGVTQGELLATEPFLATRLLQGFFYFVCEHESPIGVVASSYLVEYTTSKLTPRQIQSMKETLGEEKIKGQLAHVNTDVGDDHAGEMWRILRYLIHSEADVEKVLRYFDDIQAILAMYFRELYEATVEAPATAARPQPQAEAAAA